MLRMSRQKLFIMIVSLLLVVPGCSYFSKADDTQLKEANKLEEEASGLATKAYKARDEGVGKEDEIKAEKKDKARIKTLNEEQAGLYDQAARDATQATNKYEEAGKLKIEDNYKKYLELRAQEARKLGAYLTTLKEVPDSRLGAGRKPEKGKPRPKISEINARADKLKKEVEDLKAQADKLQKENGDKYKAKKS
jgi:ribosomal protein L29